MVHHNNCPLCKGTEIIHFLTCTDYLVSCQEFHLCRCKSCEFVFTRDYPEESESGRYYESDDYISHSGTGGTLFEIVYSKIRQFMLRKKKNLINRTSDLRTGTILDIGSGTGHFLNAMKKTGWQTLGVEVNDKAREYAIPVFGLNVIKPETVASISSSSFDCITMWHVLEHLHNPYGWFEEIKRLLRPGGKVIVALPNCRSYDAEYYGVWWAAYDVPRHLWHFTPETFSLFAGFAGFRITGMALLPFDVFYISVLSEKHRGSFVPALTGLLKGIGFSVISAFNRKKSSSIVYIMERDGD